MNALRTGGVCGKIYNTTLDQTTQLNKITQPCHGLRPDLHTPPSLPLGRRFRRECHTNGSPPITGMFVLVEDILLEFFSLECFPWLSRLPKGDSLVVSFFSFTSEYYWQAKNLGCTNNSTFGCSRVKRAVSEDHFRENLSRRHWRRARAYARRSTSVYLTRNSSV